MPPSSPLRWAWRWTVSSRTKAENDQRIAALTHAALQGATSVEDVSATARAWLMDSPPAHVTTAREGRSPHSIWLAADNLVRATTVLRKRGLAMVDAGLGLESEAAADILDELRAHGARRLSENLTPFAVEDLLARRDPSPYPDYKLHWAASPIEAACRKLKRDRRVGLCCLEVSEAIACAEAPERHAHGK